MHGTPGSGSPLVGHGPLRARIYEYAGHVYLLLADDLTVTEMLPIKDQDATRVREVLAQPHQQTQHHCTLTLEDADGRPLHRQPSFASPQDAGALAVVLLNEYRRASGARITGVGENGDEQIWLDRHGHR